MEKKSTITQEIFTSEEEKTLVWENVQSSFEKDFGHEVYSSWLKSISLLKEYNDYLVLGVPTRFFRDWIVSRYLDKILSLLKTFKNSVNRVEFKIIEDGKANSLASLDPYKIDNLNKVTEIKDSILNYNRLNPNLNFESFISGSSNEVALSSSKKVCEQISRYNPLYIYGGVGLGKTHLLNAIGIELEKTTNVMFISAERFMYHFIKSIKKNDMGLSPIDYPSSQLYVELGCLLMFTLQLSLTLYHSYGAVFFHIVDKHMVPVFMNITNAIMLFIFWLDFLICVVGRADHPRYDSFTIYVQEFRLRSGPLLLASQSWMSFYLFFSFLSCLLSTE